MAATSRPTIRHDRRPGDLGRIVTLHAELYAREYGFGPRFEGYVASAVAAFGNPANPDRGRLWVAELHGELVGSIGILARDGNAAQLRLLLVAPAARGTGLGRSLAETAVAFCRAVGYDSIFLWTVRGLPAAAALYASLGFVKTAELPPDDWGVPVVEERYDLRLA